MNNSTTRIDNEVKKLRGYGARWTINADYTTTYGKRVSFGSSTDVSPCSHTQPILFDGIEIGFMSEWYKGFLCPIQSAFLVYLPLDVFIDSQHFRDDIEGFNAMQFASLQEAVDFYCSMNN